MLNYLSDVLVVMVVSLSAVSPWIGHIEMIDDSILATMKMEFDKGLIPSTYTGQIQMVFFS